VEDRHRHGPSLGIGRNGDGRRVQANSDEGALKGGASVRDRIRIEFLYGNDSPPMFLIGIARPTDFDAVGALLVASQDGIQDNLFPVAGGQPGRQIDLVTGCLDDRSQSQWGRPVDIKPASDDSVLISDDRLPGASRRPVKSTPSKSLWNFLFNILRPLERHFRFLNVRIARESF
jgi:hypothetical protein